MDPEARKNGWNGQLVKWVLGIAATLVTAIALASGGTALRVWAQTNTNAVAVKECNDKLDEHCKKQETLDGDIRVIRADVVHLTDEQRKTREKLEKVDDKLDIVLGEVRKR